MVSHSNATDGVSTGQQRPATTWGEYNNIAFAIQQAIGKIQTCTLVKVVSCTNSGGVSAVGLVDVIPLVKQIDGQGIGISHVTIHNIPYFRLQGGANAIIIDPQPGDIGFCGFASRDITRVKATKTQENPGSLRQYSFSDGLYIGGMLNGAPTQYVQFSSDGITIHSPTEVKIEAPIVTINASTSATINTPTFVVNGNTILNGTLSQGFGSDGGGATMRGPLIVTQDVTAEGTSLHTHVHGGVRTGDGTTGTPE